MTADKKTPTKQRSIFSIFKIVVLLFLFTLISGCLLTKTKRFGRLPEGKQLEQIKRLPNYRNGAFQNEELTPNFSEGVSAWDIFVGVLTPVKNVKPIDPIPTQHTDLKKIDPNQDVLVWMGHSSSFLQLSGKRILIDPVLSKSASPVSFINRAYEGTSIYRPEDFPEIDVLIISHDHWDHLDYLTVIALRSKIKKVVCGIGTGEHFRRWGFSEEQIEERDWNEEV